MAKKKVSAAKKFELQKEAADILEFCSSHKIQVGALIVACFSHCIGQMQQADKSKDEWLDEMAKITKAYYELYDTCKINFL